MTSEEFLNSKGIYSLDTKSRTKEVIQWMEDFANQQNKELILCLENSTKIMEDQEGEVMDLVIYETMNHQIKWNKETLETNMK